MLPDTYPISNERENTVRLMMKMQCSKCSKSFIWTDDLPLRGKCPTDDCDWHYDVRKELGKALEKKAVSSPDSILCPSCRNPITSKWTICASCGNVVAGKQYFTKKHLFTLVVFLLVILSLIYRYWS